MGDCSCIKFGMILWKVASQNYTILPVTRTLQWLNFYRSQRQTTIGISGSLDRFKIRSYNQLPPLWTSYVQDLGEVVGRIKCVGNSLLGVFSMFVLILEPYDPQTLFFFHGKLFGKQKCLQRLVSLFGQKLWG